MAETLDFTQGDTLKALRVTITDSSRTPVNLTGGTVALKGVCPDIATVMSITGSLITPASGICQFAAVGNCVTAVQMGSRASVTYSAQVKYTTSGALIGWSSPIRIRITKQPAA